MRDIVFKNLTSTDHHKRDVVLSEAFVLNGVTTKTQKHFTYFVRDHALMHSPEELTEWIKRYASKGPQLKDLSVVKSYDSKVGEEKFEVKIIGNLYVLRDQDIYSVDFIQEFRIDRSGDGLKRQRKKL
ncbi:MAG: hypothetical protein JW714_01305 [Candidatus Omnitrophica bacterium]|nr:hypothetical protein [Candidatus Omnitrophota bacterium]